MVRGLAIDKRRGNILKVSGLALSTWLEIDACWSISTSVVSIIVLYLVHLCVGPRFSVGIH